MLRTTIYHFAVESEFEIPSTPDETLNPLAQSIPVKLKLAESTLQDFQQVYWIGRRYRSALRAYDVSDGILICAGDCVRLHVHLGGQNVRVYHPTVDLYSANTLQDAVEMEFNRSYAAALVVNLGLSVCTLLQQRLPVHGAAVEIDSKIVGIMAASGTGKTTLLWEIIRRGGVFATDDVFTVRHANSICISPSVALHAKLTKSALEAEGMNWLQYQEMLPGSGEFWIPIPFENRIVNERPLDALFVLRPNKEGTDPSRIDARRMAGGAALALLMENTQGLWACYPMLDAAHMFNLYSMIAACVPIYILSYARRFEALPILVETIRRMIRH